MGPSRFDFRGSRRADFNGAWHDVSPRPRLSFSLSLFPYPCVDGRTPARVEEGTVTEARQQRFGFG
jgi:hypothetical protein